MLRITTTPPEAKKLTSASEADLEESKSTATDVAPAATTPGTNTNAGSGWTKPGFIRALSVGKGSGNAAPASEQGNAAETTTTEQATTSAPAPAPAPASTDPLGAGQTGH